MILTDHKIKDYGQKLVAPFAGDRVQAVGYDLTAKTFLLSSEQASSEVTLEPMASVFVQCEEEIALPADITSTIQLRNSRIRQGLILTAPRYYPGHCKPVYFRVTNFSGEAVRLAAGDGIATIIWFTPSILAIQNLQLKGMATFSKGLEQIIGIHIHPQRRSAISLNGV